MYLALLAACADEAAAPAVQPAPADDLWTCDTDVVSQPDRLKRLTMGQYRNTAHDLVRSMVPGQGEVDSIVAQLGLEDLNGPRYGTAKLHRQIR